MIEVRRDADGELCGHVVERDGRWLALAVFGGLLGTHPCRDDAARQVLADGLASLAERWQLHRNGDDSGETVCIVEADPQGVTLALGYYSMPGVPTMRLTRDDLGAGGWRLVR